MYELRVDQCRPAWRPTGAVGGWYWRRPTPTRGSDPNVHGIYRGRTGQTPRRVSGTNGHSSPARSPRLNPDFATVSERSTFVLPQTIHSPNFCRRSRRRTRSYCSFRKRSRSNAEATRPLGGTPLTRGQLFVSHVRSASHLDHPHSRQNGQPPARRTRSPPQSGQFIGHPSAFGRRGGPLLPLAPAVARSCRCDTRVAPFAGCVARHRR